MAPNKKKKKASPNIARGFATTSVASKPKFERDVLTERAISEISSDSTSVETLVGASTLRVNDEREQRLLTPEEFEMQLEESSLQLLVEKYASTCKRQSARQVSKLQTDLRLLRTSGGSINIRKWLPQDLMDDILDLIRQDIRNGNFGPDPSSNAKSKVPTEDDLIVKLWTLQLVLLSIGFPKAKVKDTLQQILDNPAVVGEPGSSTKENVWGLQEAFDWLALTCNGSELPDYEAQQRLEIAVSTPQGPSGTSTPNLQLQENHSVLGSREIAGALHSRSNSKHRFGMDGAADSADLPTDVPRPALSKDGSYAGNSDSDIEPDELVPLYLSTKKQLFELQPESVPPTPGRNRKNKHSISLPLAGQTSSSPEIKKLLEKLRQIESDVLFDKDEADLLWREKQAELRQEDAARRKLGLQLPHTNPPTGSNDGHASGDSHIQEGGNLLQGSEKARDASQERQSDHRPDEDEDDLLGELFANLPENVVDSATGESSMIVSKSDGLNITIRDFGKCAGANPRKVLEEACRTRDSNVRFLYKIISSSSFSHRHSLTVLWSKDQPPLSQSPLPSVISWSDSRSMTFQMTTLSTPDSRQSESYISVAALFLILHATRKDEKVYLRLPSVWREVWGEFVEANNKLIDEKDRDTLREIKAIVQIKMDREYDEGVIVTKNFQKRNAVMNGKESNIQKGSEDVNSTYNDSDALQDLWRQKSSSHSFQSMLRYRAQLPMWGFKPEVLKAIDEQQVVIICGETGCGKSTQVPSFILEHELSKGNHCKVYCTEPRRISAISLAKRVSEELGERKNDIGSSRSFVGYAIRLESNISKETRIVYATTGIVMRMLERSGDLGEITHLVLDEVHERSIDSDFLLIVLRRLMERRRDLKVILMSATVDAQRFSTYLGGAPILTVPGRTFPVQTKFLEDAIEVTGYTPDENYGNNVRSDPDDAETDDNADATKSISAQGLTDTKYSDRTLKTLDRFNELRIDYNLILKLIEKIAEDDYYLKYSKAILVFLPGMAEIKQLNDILLGHPAFQNSWYIYPLHSTIASEEQEWAFLVPPEGTRKIVLATNIAETGITIPDITCVIDTGKHKEMRFDAKRQLSRLTECFISRANAKQRRGRAGRVQEGLCFHLFTKTRHDQLLAEQQTPEMLRLSLEDLVLRVKICNLGDIEGTLSDALDPPPAKNIRRTIDALIDVKALTSAENLTPLGQQLARLPLDVHLGKLILLGCIYKCLDLSLTLAAILSSKSPFSAPMGARQQANLARLAFRRGDSDLLTVWNAYSAWKRVCSTPGGSEYQFCRKNFLSPQSLSNIEDLKQQLLVCVVDAGFLELGGDDRVALNKARFSHNTRSFYSLPSHISVNSNNDLIASSVIAWSFYPKLLVRDGKGWRNVTNNQHVSLSPMSVNKSGTSAKWLSYYHIMQSNKSFLNAHETTPAEDFAIALLCGDADFRMYAGTVTLDGNKVRFTLPDWKSTLAMKVLRLRLREIMARSFKQPGKPLTKPMVKWLDVWQRIFDLREERERERRL